MKCPKHPRYRGIKEPLNCAACQEIFNQLNILHVARKERKVHEERLHTASTLREALGRIDELETEVQAVKVLQGSHHTTTIQPRHSSGISEATAVACATDWHLGSRVRPEQITNLNAFDIAICRERVKTFFERVVRLTSKERKDVIIKELVLFLGGDLIDGALHGDTVMSNEIAEPISQAIIAQELIESGLNFLLNHGRYERITVVCCDGNHSRITNWSLKMCASSRKGNSLEYFMYYNLANRFPQLNWLIADGLFVYVDILGHVVRFHHGDTISFGGVQGPYMYLNRRIYQWDQGVKAEYSVMGHLHCWTVGTRRWLINGSLIGYSPYALTFGGEYQPPIQGFFLMDKKRGPTVQIPILL